MCQLYGPAQGEVEMNFHSLLFIYRVHRLCLLVIFYTPSPSSFCHPQRVLVFWWPHCHAASQMVNIHTQSEGHPCVGSHDRGTLLISSGTTGDYRSYLPHVTYTYPHKHMWGGQMHKSLCTCTYISLVIIRHDNEEAWRIEDLTIHIIVGLVIY